MGYWTATGVGICLTDGCLANPVVILAHGPPGKARGHPRLAPLAYACCACGVLQDVRDAEGKTQALGGARLGMLLAGLVVAFQRLWNPRR